jgi:hypothetical protein
MARWAIGCRPRCMRPRSTEAAAKIGSPPAPPLRGARRAGPRRYDMSCELAFEDQLMSALPHSPTTPSSRFAESDKFKLGPVPESISAGTLPPEKGGQNGKETVNFRDLLNPWSARSAGTLADAEAQRRRDAQRGGGKKALFSAFLGSAIPENRAIQAKCFVHLQVRSPLRLRGRGAGGTGANLTIANQSKAGSLAA